MDNTIAFNTGAASADPVLVLDKEGMAYMGQRVEDAGAAYSAFMAVMAQMRQAADHVPVQAGDISAEESANRLRCCAIAVSDWLAGGCDANVIPKPQIAALVAWTKESATHDAPAPVAQGVSGEDLAYFIRRTLTLEAHAAGESWCWRGNGTDNLGSMVGSLPVVIRADQLRALIAAPAPVAQQLTEPLRCEVIAEMARKRVNSERASVYVPPWVIPFARDIERAHGIKATGQEGGAA